MPTDPVEETDELVHDLMAVTARLEAELRDLRQRVQDLTEIVEAAGQGAAAARPAEAGPGGPTGGDESEGKKSAPAPMFILYFDPGSEEENAELAAMDEWVRGVLVPTYVGQVSSRQPWCDRWWEHPEAVARLHALWLAWQELTDENAGGHTGPSVWHRDHLDEAMAKLRSHDGPFAACMINTARLQHRDNHITPVRRFERA